MSIKIDLTLLVQTVAALDAHDTRRFFRDLGKCYHEAGRPEDALDLFMLAAKLVLEART